MTSKRFLSGMTAVLLAFALVLTACESPLTDGGTVGISSLDAPKVAATVKKGGVLLEWSPILDASSYAVWRKATAGNEEPVRLNGNFSQIQATGKYRYIDLVSDTNELKVNTEYTYTVTASGGSKTTAKTEVKATPTDIPAKGTKLAAVSEVTLKLDQEAEKISVSWTEAADAVPSQYYIAIYRNGSYINENFVKWAVSGEISASFGWYQSQQTDGEYTAWVVACDYLSGLNDSAYFKRSDIAVSAGQKFEALFGTSSSGSAERSSINADNSNNIIGFHTKITFGSAKPGVTYTVERAPVDVAGNVGTYEEVSVYKNPGDTKALGTADLTADILGNLPNPTVFDKVSATTAGIYKYRIKATKGGVTQTKEISSTVTFDPRDFTSVSISIGAASGTDTKTYAVTPGLTYKGALQAGDKLVFYYVKGTSNDSLYTGPYTQGIEFTKAELEAATVASKNLAIPKTTNDNVAYVQAYFVFADGRAPKNAITYYNVSGDGKESTDQYNPGSGYIYYVSLNY